MRKTLTIVAASAALLLGACGDDEPEVLDSTVDADREVVDGEVVDDDYSTLDANGDSYLDADEVAEWVDDVGAFNEWDIDGDSELDQDDVSGNAFEKWDGDGDGVITEEEWEFATPLWYPEGADVGVYADWDDDGDSELDADEFTEHFDTSALGDSWTADTLDEDLFKEAYFELYDDDLDGQVTEDEWERGVATFGIAG